MNDQPVSEYNFNPFFLVLKSSTSPPGGNQVDGLPPALSNFASLGKTNREGETNKLMTRGQKSEVYEKSENSIGLRSCTSQQIY